MSQKPNPIAPPSTHHIPLAGDSSLWDDSALIRAYDQSLMLQKEVVAKRIAQSTNTDDDGLDSEGPTASASAAAGPSELGPLSAAAGDFVRCTFSEDGVDYEAQVISRKGDLCWIRYIGYDNEESVDATALVASWGPQVREEQRRAAGGEKQPQQQSSAAEPADPTPSASGSPPQSAPPKAKKSATAAAAGKHPNKQQQQRTFDRYRVAMAIPPPPPLPPMVLGDAEEAEHLSSMLMAWYMSGYYTGVYQGQRMAKESRRAEDDE